MSDMIEQVANAIAAKYAPAVDQRAPYAKIMMLEAAKAAIEAMREPAGQMVPDGWLAAHRVQTKDRCNHEMLRRAWVAMIDSALEDAP